MTLQVSAPQWPFGCFWDRRRRKPARPVDCRNETVAFRWYRHDETGRFRVVLQRLPNFPNGGADGAFGVEVDVFPPDPLDDFPTRHQLPAMLDKQAQEFKGNALQVYALARSAEFKGTAVKLEFTESEAFIRHSEPPKASDAIVLARGGMRISKNVSSLQVQKNFRVSSRAVPCAPFPGRRRCGPLSASTSSEWRST